MIKYSERTVKVKDEIECCDVCEKPASSLLMRPDNPQDPLYMHVFYKFSESGYNMPERHVRYNYTNAPIICRECMSLFGDKLYIYIDILKQYKKGVE